MMTDGLPQLLQGQLVAGRQGSPYPDPYRFFHVWVI
jgi:hypothetical protein